ncbi:MAG: esterase [Balneola sp.]|jgi:acetyl esterase/lipase|nr:esterase [Balneola sp.]MBE77569.1 esterase [Balneola sp.]HBX65702.1 esterase [Balneolaceae bacterium]|tara:strand:- start:429 stop:1346 length:918 start_codon:yes stop_codon:yes gene_type:complete
MLFFIGQSLLAQDFPRDTSYTLQSAYQKYVKEYPNIALVDQQLEDQLKIQKNIVYKNTGNRNLHVDVYHPKEINELLPAVLIVHGGGWISGDKSMMKQIAMELAFQGYVAVAVEYRLSPEAQYPAAIYDVKSALKWMRDHSSDNQIDPHKIAVMGTSAGGQIAALVATTQNKGRFEDPADSTNTAAKVQALVDIDGVLAFIHPVSEEGRVAGLWLGGTQIEKRDTWIDASALTHVNRNTPPTLFIGSAYPRFLAGQKEMSALLDKHNIYNQSYKLDAPHSFWLFHPWFEPTMSHVVSFLNDTLKR